MFSIIYYFNRILKKLRGSAIINSKIHSTSKVQSGSQIVNSCFGKYSYCGYDCKLLNCFIGSFTSIADDVIIGGVQHPLDWISTSPVFYEGRNCLNKNFSFFPRPVDLKTNIGNDVWIGDRVIIKAGVSIGDGAVIGMGSVVTKDILPYAIVGGVPAKTIKMRFDESIVQQLIDSKWWNIDDKKLNENAIYIRDTKIFLEKVRLLQKYLLKKDR